MASVAAQSQFNTHPRSIRSAGPVTLGTVLLSLALAAAVFAVYWPVRTHPFLPNDDNFYITDNPYMHKGVNWATIRWAFTARDMVNWIPLTWLAHAADYQLFGASPAGHHLVNVVLHTLAAVLLFLTLRQSTGYTGRSLMVAGLFALHPINVESVAWAAELKTSLSMIFFVATLAAYRWYTLRESTVRYLLVGLLYGCGLMAKPQIIMLPIVLLLWDYWPLQRMFPEGSRTVDGTNGLEPMPTARFYSLVLEKLPLLALALLDAVLTLQVQAAGRPHWEYSLGTRVANALVAYVRYIGKMFWPEWLSINYPHPGNTLPAWQIAGAAALLIAISALVVGSRRRYLVVGWLWFLISMAPMSGIIHFGDFAMADRYAYQPLCGLFLAICWSIAEFAEERHVPATALASVGIAVLVALTAVTARQIHYWRTNLALWSHALELTPNATAEIWVGENLRAQGQEGEGLQHLQRALEIDPNNSYGNIQMAFYHHQRGDFPKAIEYYEAALRDPRIAVEERRRALINLGHCYGKRGDTERAKESFAAAEKIPESYYRYGTPSAEH